MRVLLIEDEVRLAETVRRGLVAEGMLVDVAHDGDQGLFAAQTQGYDVIVLDIMLPKRNGYDVCRDLRASEIWTPVLSSSPPRTGSTTRWMRSTSVPMTT